MGNMKSIPVVGETITIIESGTKLFVAVVLRPFDRMESRDWKESAGDAWIEYSEKNIIVGPINSGIRKLAGDDEGAARVIKSTN